MLKLLKVTVEGIITIAGFVALTSIHVYLVLVDSGTLPDSLAMRLWLWLGSVVATIGVIIAIQLAWWQLEHIGKLPVRLKLWRHYRKDVPRESWEWKELRRLVWLRDDRRCQHCDKSLIGRTYHCHHKKMVSEGGEGNSRNLITLCPPCHYRVHSGKAGA